MKENVSNLIEISLKTHPHSMVPNVLTHSGPVTQMCISELSYHIFVQIMASRLFAIIWKKAG